MFVVRGRSPSYALQEAFLLDIIWDFKASLFILIHRAQTGSQHVQKVTKLAQASSFSGGRPHGSNIFCSRLYFMRPMLSFSATAKYASCGWWPM